MKLHHKGYLLTELSQAHQLWDDTLITQTLLAYNESGTSRENTLRIALDELAAAGLINRVEQKLETNADNKTILRFKYQLSDFGRTRMLDTGLLQPA